MTETPKDKQARALERIKALSSKRATANRPDVEPGGQPNAKGQKGGGAKRGVGHRPQGG